MGGTFQFDPSRPFRPYKWAQHLGGIDVLSSTAPLQSLTAQAASGVGNVKEMLKQNALTAGLATFRQQRRVHTVIDALRAAATAK